jgi:hypothetical protein
MTQPLGLARRLGGGRGTVFRVGDGRVFSFLRLAGVPPVFSPSLTTTDAADTLMRYLFTCTIKSCPRLSSSLELFHCSFRSSVSPTTPATELFRCASINFLYPLCTILQIADSLSGSTPYMYSITARAARICHGCYLRRMYVLSLFVQ